MDVQALIPSRQQDATDRHGRVDRQHQSPGTAPPPSYEKSVHDNFGFEAPFQSYDLRYPFFQEVPPVADNRAASSLTKQVDPRVYPNQQEYIVVTQPLVASPDMRHTVAPPPNDCMGCAIFVALCCCLPLGIGAIVYASKTRSAIAVGNFSKAQGHAQSARILVILGLVLGIVFGVGIIIVEILSSRTE